MGVQMAPVRLDTLRIPQSSTGHGPSLHIWADGGVVSGDPHPRNPKVHNSLSCNKAMVSGVHLQLRSWHLFMDDNYKNNYSKRISISRDTGDGVREEMGGERRTAGLNYPLKDMHDLFEF